MHLLIRGLTSPFITVRMTLASAIFPPPLQLSSYGLLSLYSEIKYTE